MADEGAGPRGVTTMAHAKPLTFTRNPGQGVRCYTAGHRFHHGMAGAAITAAGCALIFRGVGVGVLVVAAGMALMYHDRRDVPWTRHV